MVSGSALWGVMLIDWAFFHPLLHVLARCWSFILAEWNLSFQEGFNSAVDSALEATQANRFFGLGQTIATSCLITTQVFDSCSHWLLSYWQLALNKEILLWGATVNTFAHNVQLLTFLFLTWRIIESKLIDVTHLFLKFGMLLVKTSVVT